MGSGTRRLHHCINLSIQGRVASIPRSPSDNLADGAAGRNHITLSDAGRRLHLDLLALPGLAGDDSFEEGDSGRTGGPVD